MILAPIVTIISTLLALGIIKPFERGKSEALADSQASTLAAGTSKIRINARSSGARPLRYTGIGVYDYREARGRFIYNFTRTAGFPRAAAVEARFFQNVMFRRRLPGDEREGKWQLIDLEQDPKLEADLRPEGEAAPAAVASTAIDDPTAVLERMAAAGSVRDHGTVRSLGAELHKYSGTLPATGGAGRTTATAWIDGDDLIRRLELAGEGGRTTEMLFYDFGVEVDTTPPPDGEVALYRDDLIAEVQAGGGG